jgi:hypothetical protein
VDAKELEDLNLLHDSHVDENGGVLGPPFPVIHKNVLCLDNVEGEVDVLAPHGQISDLFLIVVRDQAYHCCVISKLIDGVGVMPGRAVMSEQGSQEGTKHASMRGPVLRISLAYVLLPTHSTWGWPIRKARIQLQREVFSPRVLRLVREYPPVLDKNEWEVIGIGQTIYTLSNTTQFGVDSCKVYCKCHMAIASCNTLKIQQGANPLHRGFSYWKCNPSQRPKAKF